MNQNIDENKINEYRNHFIETKNYIALVPNYNGGCLYLKDYSKIVQSVGNKEFVTIPENFKEKEISILENPTEEEKMILATNLSPFSTEYLSAIVKGRKLLETKSKEEAIKECETEMDDAVRDMVLIDQKFEESIKQADVAKLTIGYLDGSLYEMSKSALSMFASSSLQVENVKSNMESMKEQEPVQPAQEVKTEVVAEAIKEPVQVSTTAPVEIPMVAEVPSTPGQEPSVVEEQPQAVSPTPSVAQSITVPSYDQMLAEVINGGASEQAVDTQPTIASPTAAVIPTVATAQPPKEVPAPQSVITPPTSLEAMVAEDAAPSFDSSIGNMVM